MDRTGQTAIMESDAVDLNQLKHKIYQEAIRDIGQSGYEAHIRDLFGRPVLDFAKTLVKILSIRYNISKWNRADTYLSGGRSVDSYIFMRKSKKANR